MFFVQKVVDWRRREFFLIHWLPTIIIFVAFMGVTLWSWQTAKIRAEQDRRQELISKTDETKNRISERVSLYQELLRAGAVLFQASTEVTPEEWKTFSDLFEIEKRYPSVRAISYLEAVPASDLAAHTARVRQQPGKEDYKVFPAGDRGFYAPFLYMEPDTEADPTTKNIGFDAYSSPERKLAIDDAIKSGNPAFTETVYTPDDKEQKIPSTGIYYPIFKENKKNGENLNDVTGLVQVLARNDKMFEGVLPEDPENTFAERIYIENSTQPPLYQSADFNSISASAEAVSERSRLDLGNISWIVEVASNEDSGTPEIQERPDNILIGGTLISLVMASFVYYLLLIRTRSIAHKEDIELQSAKDELLALASHQLRTPATGVKQYVGMLLQGYAGHLTPKQNQLLKKADESNERQLNTINEMLSVARADSGRLRIDPVRTDIKKLLKDVVEEQSLAIERRQQKITLTTPKEGIHAYVDPQYFRMAVENIISNASKYTPEKGAIDIDLEEGKNKLYVSVADTGIGIPVRHYPLLFKKFSRIPSEFGNQVSGTGIGLYLAKHLVEAHGGQLTFSSDPGVGSTFKIVLPYKKKRGVQ